MGVIACRSTFLLRSFVRATLITPWDAPMTSILTNFPCSTGGSRATAPMSSTFPSGNDSPALSEPRNGAQPETNSKIANTAMSSLVTLITCILLEIQNILSPPLPHYLPPTLERYNERSKRLAASYTNERKYQYKYQGDRSDIKEV